MKTILTLSLTAGLLGSATLASADLLEVKTGQIPSENAVSATAGQFPFETGGRTQTIGARHSEIMLLAGGGPLADPPAPAAQPASSVSIPAGTTLLVRMVDPVSSKDPQGKRFTTTLESDLAVNGVVVARAGTKIYGRVQSAQKAGRFAGQSALDLRLTEIAIGPNLVPLMTAGYTQSGAKSVGKTARGAAGGAAIGAIAGDAGKGAAIGAVASGLKKGENVSVNPGTLLEFQLQQPVSVTP